MSDERPRRRRSVTSPPEEPRGAFPLFPLFIVVILAGLGLGFLLSRHFGSQRQTTTTKTTATTLAAPTQAPTDSPAPNAEPTQTQSAQPTSSPSASPSAPPKPPPAPRQTPHRVALNSPQPKPVVKPSPSPSAIATPSPKPPPPTAAPRPVPTAPPVVHTARPATPKPATPKPATSKPAPPPATGGAAASQLARSYLDALISGDTGTANRLLNRSSGSSVFPEQGIVNRTSTITSIRSTDNHDGTYKIEAELSGSNGNFYCTYQTAHGEAGEYLTDNYCIRTQ